MKNTRLLFKAILVSTVLVLICFNLCSCLLFYVLTDDRDLEFLHPESEIKMIEIVEVVGDPEGNYVKGGPKQTIVAEVENTVAFMKELKAIKGHYCPRVVLIMIV